jgi:hypothetical protein
MIVIPEFIEEIKKTVKKDVLDLKKAEFRTYSSI